MKFGTDRNLTNFFKNEFISFSRNSLLAYSNREKQFEKHYDAKQYPTPGTVIRSLSTVKNWPDLIRYMVTKVKSKHHVNFKKSLNYTNI